MLFWNSLGFLMTLWMLAIWSLVPLPFLKPAWTSGSSQFTYCWSLAWRILSITLLMLVVSVECIISSVLSRHNKNLKWWMLKPTAHHSSWTGLQLRVTAHFYLEHKRKYILEAWGDANPKDMKRERETETESARERERDKESTHRREAPGPLLLFLYVLSSPWVHPM